MKLLIAVLIVFLFSAAADSCSDFMFPDNKVFTSCTNLSLLNSFLYWSQNPSSTTLDMAYRHSHVPPSTWVAWGINPKPNKMVGTQAIIAYQKPDGNMAVYTSSVDSYATQLQKGNLSFPVSDLSALFSNDEIIIFATIQLPNNSSTINHVWQDGPITGNHLGIHDLSGHHLQSMGTLNLLSGQVFASHGSDSKTKLKISHGVLNTISWGIMMPIGLLVARYLKAVGPAADPLWFYLHIVVQLSAYIIGLAGGATGFLLLSKSSGIHHPCHLGIGIILFSLGLLQVSALLLRPSKDHKYRYLWNLFHHNTGYAVILLSFFNIWFGFSILKPAKKWMIAYGVVLGALILSAFLLEVWKKFARDGRTGGAHEEVNKSAKYNSKLLEFTNYITRPQAVKLSDQAPVQCILRMSCLNRIVAPYLTLLNWYGTMQRLQKFIASDGLRGLGELKHLNGFARSVHQLSGTVGYIGWKFKKGLKVVWEFIPYAIMWNVWIARNKFIFRGLQLNWQEVVGKNKCKILIWATSKEVLWLFKKAKELNLIKAVELNQSGVSLIFLQFTDETLIFCNADIDDIFLILFKYYL
ncbi:hypothetical protein ACSBR2_016274 [Camellia fascicularis]